MDNDSRATPDHDAPNADVPRDMAMRRRALRVLGVAPEHEFDVERLRHAFHCRMLRHHPDANPSADAGRAAALVNEAYRLLRGRTSATGAEGGSLLLDDELTERVAGEPLDGVAGAPSYEEWIQGRFMDLSSASIWPT
ncbi:MAG: J domain-containing protein [Desulfovibrionaceae bacterium]|jgi:hypothetical protein|nr:J domain-containing protein [Desulfovibrionaceae bacterium]